MIPRPPVTAEPDCLSPAFRFGFVGENERFTRGASRGLAKIGEGRGGRAPPVAGELGGLTREQRESLDIVDASNVPGKEAVSIEALPIVRNVVVGVGKQAH